MSATDRCLQSVTATEDVLPDLITKDIIDDNGRYSSSDDEEKF